MGKLIISNITGADIKRLISTLTDKGYSFSTVKQTYNLLNEYFDYLMREEFIKKNPMNAVPTIKKSNYLAKQNKEVLPVCETITVFTDEEIEKFKAEAYKKYPSGKPKHSQASAYILMLNTGLRTAEALGLINSDIDLEKKVMHIQRGVKEAQKRDGTERKSGREIVVGSCGRTLGRCNEYFYRRAFPFHQLCKSGAGKLLCSRNGTAVLLYVPFCCGQ